jgi:general secretion pathway protein B
MSYILDALKRADSERRRGTVPSIFAQQATYVSAEPQARGNIKAVLWLIAGLLAVITAGLAWKLTSNDPTGDRAALASNTAVAPTPANLPAPAAVAVNPPAAGADADTGEAPDTNVAPSRPTVAAQSRTASAPGAAASRRPAAPAAQRPPATNAAPPVSAAANRSAAAADPSTPPAPSAKTVRRPEPRKEDDTTTLTSTQRVYAVSELPADIQQQLPKLAISGGAYSTDPASRLLIVNNQVFTEKSQPVPGLSVEQIRRNAVVLSYKGYLYRVAY